MNLPLSIGYRPQHATSGQCHGLSGKPYQVVVAYTTRSRCIDGGDSTGRA